MKVLNFRCGDEIHLGLAVKTGILDITAARKDVPGLPATMMELILAGKTGLQNLKAFAGSPAAPLPLAEDTIVFAPPVTNPEKIMCIGYNYASHAVEVGAKAPPSFPQVFGISNNALASHGQAITLPPTARLYDYEAELVIVIGKECYGVTGHESLNYVFGYTCGNDLSARDLQGRTSQVYLGKSLDGFAPTGPYIATADAVNPSNLAISTKRNGEVVQKGNTNQLIFDCSYLISYLSQYMPLRPGDLIFTGTPSGAIAGRPKEEQRWVGPNEVLTVSIEGVGDLTNTTI